jgi:ribonuclease T1
MRLGFRALFLAFLLASSSLAPQLGRGDETVVCGTREAAEPGPQDAALRGFAHELGIEAVEAFVGTAESLYRKGALPACYLDRAAAEALGWRPGAALWDVAPGDAIGGDRFRNFEGRLPAQFDGRYREADLDYRGGHRNARRLIYVEGSAGAWLEWVTLDHYRSFHKLPDAAAPAK